MNKSKKKITYTTPHSFLKDAKPSSLIQEVREEILSEMHDTILDLSQLKYNESWSILANKIVGAEHF